MPLLDRRAKLLRLTPDQMDRLARAAKFRGQTQQGFVLTALLRAIEDAAAEEAVLDQQRQQQRPGGAWRGEAPRGLGILSRRAPLNTAAPSTTPSAVVVNVGGSTNGTDELISQLAVYVSSGTTFGRDARLRSAIAMLEANCKTEEERRTRTEKLEAAIAAAGKERPSGSRVQNTIELVGKHLKDVLG